MSGDNVSTAADRKRRLIIPFFGCITIGLVATFFYWFFTCPCERLPGGMLLGELNEEPVDDWSFANDVALCQIQISAGLLPHSINLNCMATETGELFLSCSSCEGKYWSDHVGASAPGRIRLDGIVYPVTITRVTDNATLDEAWAARTAKLYRLQNGPDSAPPAASPRAEGWWSFQLESSG